MDGDEWMNTFSFDQNARQGRHFPPRSRRMDRGRGSNTAPGRGAIDVSERRGFRGRTSSINSQVARSENVEERYKAPGPSRFQTSNIEGHQNYHRPQHRGNTSSSTTRGRRGMRAGQKHNADLNVSLPDLRGAQADNPRNIKRNPLVTLQNIAQSDDIIANRFRTFVTHYS
ncbi:uncharacterized protein ACR2FA_000726 [Aphomia sociella]